VQITLAESFGVQGRGAFYETAGCLRDVVENHLFQVVALLAMEPPTYRGFEALHSGKLDVLRAMRRLAPTTSCAASSPATETSREWRRTPTSRPSAPCGCTSTRGAGRECRGICAPASTCQRRPPRSRWSSSRRRNSSAPADGAANYVRFRLSPDAAIALAARVKRAGEEFVGDQRELLLLDTQPGEEAPYERQVGDAMAGDGALFTREEAVEAAWSVVDRVLNDHHPVHQHQPGTWGPVQAGELIAPHARWHDP
jgi:glucose-6-phosphate 1-dehydrogenase